jgi:hypothetical protein
MDVGHLKPCPLDEPPQLQRRVSGVNKSASVEPRLDRISVCSWLTPEAASKLTPSRLAT